MINKCISSILLSFIRAYQLLLSFWLGPVCRFEPSCSAYATTAIQSHGALKGSWLTVKRFLRCHPFATGGIDPVPPCSIKACHKHPSTAKHTHSL